MLAIYDKEILKINKYISTEIIEMILKRDYQIQERLIEENIKIYSKEYSYLYAWNEEYNKKCIKENTYAIHRGEGSWVNNPNIVYLQYKHLKPIRKFFKIRKN